MVEVGDGSFSRELCGGTHVRSTAEIGLFRISSEGSSAANVRRIEALTGPEAVTLARRRIEEVDDAAAKLRVGPDHFLDALSTQLARAKEAEKAAKKSAGTPAADVDALVARAVEVGGTKVFVSAVDAADDKQLLALTDQLASKMGDAAVVLGSVVSDRPLLVAVATPSAVEKGVKAGAIIKQVAPLVGGGGGGRDTMARAGGKDPERLGEALDEARRLIDEALNG
jgi:alanyl-tRNA synthetase